MSVAANSLAFRPFYISRSRRGMPRLRLAVRSNSVTAGSILTKLKADCATPLPVLRHVANAMTADMRAGLAVDGGSDLKMILSYVDSLPSGNEKGLFYALDLGGTNFRVLRVQLGGKEERVVATEFDQVSIPEELILVHPRNFLILLHLDWASFHEVKLRSFTCHSHREKKGRLDSHFLSL